MIVVNTRAPVVQDTTRPPGRLKENWMLLLLGAIALLTFILSLEDVPDLNTPALARSTLLGALFGLLLAFSHFSGALTALYSSLLALPVCTQLIVAILPPPAVTRTLSFSEWLQLVNWRLLVILNQIPQWIKSIPGETRLSTNKGLEILLVLVTWSSSVWLFWWLLRRKNALLALLPLGVFSGFNAFSQGENLNLLLIFLLTGLLLHAAVSFRYQHSSWDQRGFSYPYEQGDWAISALVIAVLIILGARFTVVVGTSQGRQDLVELFRRPTQVADSTDETIKAFEALSAPHPNLWIGISDLDKLDTPPTPLDTTVMWARIQPESGTDFIPKAYYLRAAIFTHYTGHGWQRTLAQSFPYSDTIENITSCTGEILEQEFEILAQHGKTLFAVNTPVRASENVAVSFTHPDNSALLRGEMNKYQVTSCSTQPDADLLRRAVGEISPEIKQTYLQLPNALPERVRQLAGQIIRQAETDFDKALLIQAYLRTYYPYTLDIQAPPADHDLVDYFLFEAPGGYCSYYASAMVILLRLQDIPARIVSGFVAVEYNQERAAYRVPASAAHSWVEAYFPVYGWVLFEPTPSLAALMHETAPAEGAEASSLPSSSRTSSFKIAHLLQRVLFVAAVGFIFIALLSVALLSRFWQIQEEIEPFYYQMRRALALTGLIGSPTVTPNEFLLQVCAPKLSEKHALYQIINTATRCYVLSAFSPHPPTRAQIQTIQKQWRGVILHWFKLWLQESLRAWRRRFRLRKRQNLKR